MNIVVMNRETALIEVEKINVPARVISITSTGDVLPEFNEKDCVKTLKLQFDDIEREEQFYKVISNEDARRIFWFVKDFTSDVELLVVHCDAGRSRSAAVAAAISKFLFNDDSFIFNRPRFTPNMKVYRTVLNYLYRREFDETEEQEIKEKLRFNEEIWKYFLWNKTEYETENQPPLSKEEFEEMR